MQLLKQNEVVVGACPLLEPGSKAEPPAVARTVGTGFSAALRPSGAGARCLTGWGDTFANFGRFHDIPGFQGLRGRPAAADS